MNSTSENPTAKLSNTIWKLRHNQALTVLYFGGSITEGGAASGWRGLTTAWLRAQYPDADIREVNAAIGGTGTQLGVYRCDEDVIRQSPDLVFIEFALNDGAQSIPEVVRCNTESILRKLRRYDPNVDIVEVFTTSKSIEDHLAAGGVHNSREIHRELARHYGLPAIIDVAGPLAAAVRAADGDWLRYTNDTVHPNREGYRICGEAAIAALQDLLDTEPDGPEPHTMPDPISRYLVEAARLIDGWDFVDGGLAQPDTQVCHEWKRLYLTLCNRYPHTIGANQPGVEQSIAFSGSAIGLYGMIASDSGDLDYRIDEGAWQHLSTWDQYALRFARAGFFLLADQMDGTQPHYLTLRVSDLKNEQSTGHWVRIGAFAVG